MTTETATPDASSATVSALAAEARRHFHIKTRDDDGASFYVAGTPDNADASAPEWIKDMVYSAHGDMMPDDTIYGAVVDALDVIEVSGADDIDDLDDHAYEFADNVTIWNADRAAWLASHAHRVALVDEMVAEGRAGNRNSIMDDIALGMYREREMVWAAVVQALTERLEELG